MARGGGTVQVCLGVRARDEATNCHYEMRPLVGSRHRSGQGGGVDTGFPNVRYCFSAPPLATLVSLFFLPERHRPHSYLTLIHHEKSKPQEGRGLGTADTNSLGGLRVAVRPAPRRSGRGMQGGISRPN